MQDYKIADNLILRLTIEFSLLVIDYCEKLEIDRKFVIGRQLLRSGTSIGANAMEAQNAESKADFIHKIKIAAKEADETQYWLILCEKAKHYPDCRLLSEKFLEVLKVLNAILTRAKTNTN